jgi:hypothetical protein
VTDDPFPPTTEPSFPVGEITAVIRRPRSNRLLGAAVIIVGAAGWTVFIARQTGALETPPPTAPARELVAAPAAPPEVPAPSPAIPLPSSQVLALPSSPTVPQPRSPAPAPPPPAVVADPRTDTARLRARPLHGRGGVRALAPRKRARTTPAAGFRMPRW